MERFWKAALGVAGIGAIGLFVMWSLYKQWLKLPIFPVLSQDEAFQLFRIFLICIFVTTMLGIVAFVITRRQIKASSGDIPRHTSNLRLPNGSPFTNAQFDTYRGIWVAIQRLRQAGDALWNQCTQENLDAFILALRLAKTKVDDVSIFFEQNDYDELKELLQHFANFSIGKEQLITMRTVKEGADSMSPSVLKDMQIQILQNKQELKSYTELLDRMRRTYHDRISWEHQGG